MKKKEFAIGDNGYFFIDRVHVDESTFYREMVFQRLDDLDEKIQKISNSLKGNEKERKNRPTTQRILEKEVR